MWRSALPSSLTRVASALLAVLVPVLAGAAGAPSTLDGALERLYPAPAIVSKETLFLTEPQSREIQAKAEVRLGSKIVTRYIAKRDDASPTGFAYLDTHLVRTVSETLLIAVEPDGSVRRIEVLAFEEPREYLPSSRWFAQFEAQRLEEQLQLKRSIRTLSGATLSSRATTDAVRRVLAIHEVLNEGANR